MHEHQTGRPSARKQTEVSYKASPNAENFNPFNPVDLVQEKVENLHQDRSFIELDKLMKEKIHQLRYNGGIFTNVAMRTQLMDNNFPYKLKMEEFDDFLLDMFCIELKFYCEKRMNKESFKFIFCQPVAERSVK
jgi:hypothetical protein